MADMRRVPVGPFPVVDASADDVVRHIAGMAAAPGDTVRTAYALHVGGLNLMTMPEYVSALENADIVYADGSATVHLATLAGAKRIERAATTDIGIPIITRVGEMLGRPPKLALIGGPPGLTEDAAHIIGSRAPAEIVLTAPGYGQDEELLARRLCRVAPDLVMVGMGVPLETLWAERMKKRLDPTTILTCGGWFGFLAGNENRAPQWMQPNLEWLHRLALSPRRLLPRYAKGILTTVRLVPHQLQVRRRPGTGGDTDDRLA